MNPQEIFSASKPATVPPPPPIGDDVFAPLEPVSAITPGDKEQGNEAALSATTAGDTTSIPPSSNSTAVAATSVKATPESVSQIITSLPVTNAVDVVDPPVTATMPGSDQEATNLQVASEIASSQQLVDTPNSSQTSSSPAPSVANTNSKLPPSIMVVIYLAVFMLIGVGVFALWYQQYRKISSLNQELNQVIAERNSLTTQLEQARQDLVLSERKPIFLAEGGDFSFYQNIPNLVVNPIKQGAVLKFGEVAEDKPVNGFVMKIEGAQTNGMALDDIVNQEMAVKVPGATRGDKQDEGTKCYRSDSGENCYISDKIGFSYVERGNDYWKVVYFLRNDAHATYYLRIEFAPQGRTEANQDEYGRIGGQILSSVKIYRQQ